MFTQKDLQQIRSKGISIDDLNQQINHFKTGFPPADLVAPAIPGKGILTLRKGDEEHYLQIFRKHGPDLYMTRFIPASGAATRMFKSLYGALEILHGKSREEQGALVQKDVEIDNFLKELPQYPFYEDLKFSGEETPAQILALILGPGGLDYGKRPKGLLRFHKYSKNDRRTSFEEHVRESARYCTGRDGVLRMHLTVSPAHLDRFQIEAARVKARVEKETGIHLDISFSFQKPETDTLAVDPSNKPFRNPDSTLLFRPGGHGALIQNLDALDSDMIFISNIDNVAPDRLKERRVRNKEILGGILLEVRMQVANYLKQLTGDDRLERTRMETMAVFLHERLGVAVQDQLENLNSEQLRAWLIRTMDRPIRVCGMVKNEGEPGGGPFYVRSAPGEVSLQIVESSQIDMENPGQAAIVKRSTHFNPVDLVCGVRNFKGEKFMLTRYVDPETGFISEKSVGGKPLKALELPGLWNGAMARWLTLFVEVPVETFSPVKTVFDLLRNEHVV